MIVLKGMTLGYTEQEGRDFIQPKNFKKSQGLRLMHPDNPNVHLSAKFLTKNSRINWFERVRWIPLQIELPNSQTQTILVNISSMRKRLGLLQNEVDDLKRRRILPEILIQKKFERLEIPESQKVFDSEINHKNVDKFAVRFIHSSITPIKEKNELASVYDERKNRYKMHQKEFQKEILFGSAIFLKRYFKKSPSLETNQLCLACLKITALMLSLKTVSSQEEDLTNGVLQGFLFNEGVKLPLPKFFQMEMAFLEAIDWNLGLSSPYIKVNSSTF